jgi:hypothetical protein
MPSKDRKTVSLAHRTHTRSKKLLHQLELNSFDQLYNFLMDEHNKVMIDGKSR